MHRLFVALRPPAAIRALLIGAMGGVPGVRWQDDDQLHLTLRFIGEVDARGADDVICALDRVGGTAIDARIAGVGAFARNGRTDTLWAGVAPRDRLAALHRKVERALAGAGIAADHRAYLPHVTLARLPRRLDQDPAIVRWRANHAALATPPFVLDRMVLYESTLGGGGAHYDAVMVWPLRRASVTARATDGEDAR